MKQTYYLLYKITNLLNGMIYIGVHKTQNKEDNYFGSGKKITLAIKKYGKDNFKKEIIQECSSYDALLKLERQIVNESFIKRKDTYNLTLGGYGGWFSVKNKGLITVKDENGKTFKTSIKNPDYISGKLKSVSKGKIIVKNSKGEFLQVSINDSRYLSGELIPGRKNSTLSLESKKKIGEASSIHQKGSRNSQFGTMWITNESENRKVSKDLKILPKGFRKGRKQSLNK